MKYIIEIEDTPIQIKDSHTEEAYDVYKAKGFRSLVFDLNGLQKLERYDKRAIVHEAYERGKAYQEEQDKEKIKKVYFDGVAEGRKQAEEHDGCKGCFYEPCGENEEPCISCKYRYASQYRRADDKIRVGDEVIDHTQSKAYTGFVIEVQSADVLKMMSLKDGIWSVRRSNVDKTGRHFDEVEKLLEAMKK